MAEPSVTPPTDDPVSRLLHQARIGPDVPPLPDDDTADEVEPDPSVLREFPDYRKARQAIYDSVFEAVKNIEPVSNQKYTLRLVKPYWFDPERFTRQQRKQAILNNETLARRLKGTWELVDNATGKVVDRRTQVIARVPYLTSMGTFTVRGNEYVVVNQQRLRAGVYTRRKANGEIESHINILPGEGLSHRVFLDPSRGTFHILVGQARLPLVPVLKALGVDDAAMKDAWGPDLFAANYAKAEDTQAVRKFARRIVPRSEQSGDIVAKFRQYYESMRLDPVVTRRTLGRPYDHTSGQVLLDITRKLLAVNRGQADVDDRDSLAYQVYYGPEDLFAERIRRDAGNIRKQMLMKATARGSLKDVPTASLTPQLEYVLLSSGLGQAAEEINPAEILDKLTKVTRMGEGGIPSEESIPDEARAVQPSQLGFIDPVRTPESLRAGVDVFMARGARKGPDGKVYSQFRDLATGKLVWKSPQALADAVIAFPRTLAPPESTVPPEVHYAGVQALKKVAAGTATAEDRRQAEQYRRLLAGQPKRVPAMKGGKIVYVRREEIDYELPHFEDAFSPLGNLIPMKSAVKGQRVAMGSRMLTQALPLVQPEAPLVRGAIPGQKGRSYEEEYGSYLGAVRAQKEGVVESVTPEAVTIRYADGKTDTIELYNNFPFNRKSVTGDTRVVVRRTDGTFYNGPVAAYSPQTGDAVWSFDPTTNTPAWVPVGAFVAHPNDKPLVRVTTASGRSVDVTIDHSLLTLGPDGRLVPVTPDRLVPGKTRLPVVPWPERPDGGDFLAGVRLGVLWAGGRRRRKDKARVQVTARTDAQAAAVCRLLRPLAEQVSVHGRVVTAAGPGIAEWFSTWLPGGRPSASLWSAGRQTLAGVVAGYCGLRGHLVGNADGAVRVAVAVADKDRRDDLLQVLAALGVFATVYTLSRPSGPLYGLRVIAPHLSRLDVWFWESPREDQLRSRLRSSYRSSPYAAIPVPDDAPVELRRRARSGTLPPSALAGRTDAWGCWAASPVLWDPVVSVTPLPHQPWVYDFCVPGVEAFVANAGLLVHNTYIHQTPLVKPGDRVKPGQLLARSNYTDDQGVAALGLNARVAYMPYKGYNFEDAVVISESMAKRLSSEHMYQHEVPLDDLTRLGKKTYISIFPQKYDNAVLETLDDDGVVRPGQTVEYGQPLILAVREKEGMHNRVHRKGDKGFADLTVVWKHHEPGVVTDVVKGKNGPVVLVKSVAPMQVGDKISGRYGDKSVVAAIVPDHLMPHDKDGRPFEILLNPLSVITRINPAQIVEAALGKIATKTGKPVAIEDFESIQDLTEFAIRELKKHNLQDLEDIIDPETGKTIPGVATGVRFFMKLHHTAASKEQGRGSGAYSDDDTPAKGGESGCFVGSTRVWARRASGGRPRRVPIRQIAARPDAWRVWSVDPVTREGGWATVTDSFRPRVDELVELTFDDGTRVLATAGHRLFRADGTPVCAGDVQEGDRLCCVDGEGGGDGG